MKQPRTSANGFHCAECNKFVYIGYDSRDSSEITDAICLVCGTKGHPELNTESEDCNV